MDDSAIICNGVVDVDAKLKPKYDDETKTIPTKQDFYILPAFLSITKHY